MGGVRRRPKPPFAAGSGLSYATIRRMIALPPDTEETRAQSPHPGRPAPFRRKIFSLAVPQADCSFDKYIFLCYRDLVLEILPRWLNIVTK